MASLARKNIGHEWRRFLAAISILVLAGLLIYLQIGMVLSMWNGFGALERDSGADLVVRHSLTLDSEAGRENFQRSLSPAVESALWVHPNVQAVERSSYNQANISLTENGTPENLSFRVLNVGTNSLAFPKTLGEQSRQIMETPGYIIVTKNTARQFGFILDDLIDHEKGDLRVGGIFDGSFGPWINGLMSTGTAELIEQGNNSGPVNSYLVGLKDPAKGELTKQQLETMLARHRVRVVTPGKSAIDTGFSEILKFGPVRSFFISSAFAVFIAIVIVVQTMRSAIQAQRTEFASLRALGISRWRMSLIAMEQAFWTGIISCAFAFSIAQILQLWLANIGLEMTFSQSLVIGVSLMIMIIALMAGLISLTAVLRVRPAELLR